MDASKLRQIADKKNHEEGSATIKKIVAKLIKAAEKAATQGEYSTSVFEDKENEFFGNTNAVITEMKKLGFKVSYKEDTAYSDHVGRTMMCFEIKW